MNKKELQEFLDFKTEQYNQPEFIETDPIQIPHLFSKKEDIEISGLWNIDYSYFGIKLMNCENFFLNIRYLAYL